jgi:tRNA(Ile)-lysidine synthase
MNLFHSFIKYAEQERLFAGDQSYLLALSGGLDSTVLCELCRLADIRFFLAHCNFHLRGDESDRDEAFVRELAAAHQIPLVIRQFDTLSYAAQHQLSIQAAARALRYDWFRSFIRPPMDHATNVETDSAYGGEFLRADGILTAHHQDDNVETLLMNFLRGTGVSGMRGMLPRQGDILRPLLFASKESIAEFARDCGLSWVTDSSNDSDYYARNYLRHEIIPRLENVYPEVRSNLAGNLSRFRDIERLYRQVVEDQKKDLLERTRNEVRLPVLKWKKHPARETLIYEVLKDYHFSAAQSREALRLLDSESGKYLQSATHRLIRHRQWLILVTLQASSASLALLEENMEYLTAGPLTLRLRRMPASQDPLPTEGDPARAQLDADKLVYPIVLRQRKAGDYFYPLGMRKKKKLSRFLIDQKLSRAQKEAVWVMDMQGKLVWIVGLRIDDRFKITRGTQNILDIEMRVG